MKLAGAAALAILAAACATTPPARTETVYQYTATLQGGDVHPGARLPLVWRGTPQAITSPTIEYAARLCAALVGPYPTVPDVKAGHTGARGCPVDVPGIAVASGVAAVDLRTGAAVDQSLDLPADLAPGYYDLVTVMAYGASDTGNGWSAAGVVHVVAAP